MRSNALSLRFFALAFARTVRALYMIDDDIFTRAAVHADGDYLLGVVSSHSDSDAEIDNRRLAPDPTRWPEASSSL
jgi:transcriptional regulator GlxA family with amidase domain